MGWTFGDTRGCTRIQSILQVGSVVAVPLILIPLSVMRFHLDPGLSNRCFGTELLHKSNGVGRTDIHTVSTGNTLALIHHRLIVGSYNVIVQVLIGQSHGIASAFAAVADGM